MTDSFFNHKDDQTEADEPRIPYLNEDEESGRLSEERRMMAVMAYIPFLCFVPILKMRDDKFAYFHARQGLILFFAEIVAVIFMIPSLSIIFWKLALFVCIGAAVAGVAFALQGRMHRLPIIGDLADKLKL